MNVQTKPVQSIGVAKPLLDGPEKVSGKSLYSADFIPEDCLVGRIFSLGDHCRLTVRITKPAFGHASPQRAVLLHDDGDPVVGDGFLRDDEGNAVERQQGDLNRRRKQRAAANRQRRGDENNRCPHRCFSPGCIVIDFRPFPSSFQSVAGRRPCQPILRL